MRVGTLEIQLMADMARLSKDMRQAQNVVGGAMSQVERSVAGAKRAMQALGVGLPLAMITDQVRRMTDQYTKLDAQLRLSTRSQAEYARGMSDIRRISSIAQADLSATSMLYTRLLNVMKGTGVEQSKLATVTETVSFGLKAYGATAQEASSAALQLSQAMGANRLGGEEFRAVMEAMPNVMKVLADSMGVPLGSLRQLSIDGKITADEMVKAFGNPAIAAEFKRLAENAQTITGAWVVARNELMLLIGEFMKSSGATGGAISAFNGVAAAIRFLADNLGVLLNVMYAYVTVLGGKLIIGLVQAKAAQMALNAAHAEAIAVNLAMARSEAANALVARDITAARAWQTGVTTGLTAANKRLAAATAEVSVAEKLAAASSVGIAGKIRGAIGRAGWIGLAIFGVWSVVDFLNGMQSISDGANKLSKDLNALASQQIQLERASLIASIRSMETSMFGKKFAEDRYRVELRDAREKLKLLDAELDRRFAVSDAEFAAQQQARGSIALTHDQIVILQRYDELLKQFNGRKLTQAEFEARVHDLYGVGAKALKARLKDEEALNKQLASGREAYYDYWKSVEDTTAATIEQAKQIEWETKLVGKNKAEIDALTRARENEAISGLEATLNMMLAVGDARDDEIRKIAEQIAALYRLDAARKGKTGAEATVEAVKKERKAYEDMWKSIDKTAHDTFVSILDGGKDTATRLKEAFKNGFFDWLYSMTLKKWIINVSAVGTGAGASGAAMAGTGGGGSSWLSAGYNLFNTMKLGFDGVAMGFTELAGTISGSLQSIGVAAETAGTIGVAGAYLGAGMAGIQLGSMIAGDKKFAGMSGSTTATIGAVIGSIVGGPIGGLIGGTIGGAVNAAFGRGPKVSGTTTLAGQFGQGGFAGQYQTPWSQSGGWFSSGRSGVDVTPLTVAQAKALNSIVAGGKSVFDNLTAAAGEAQKSLAGWTFSINRQIATQEQQDKLIIDVAESMGKHLIPQLSQFRLEGENLADTAVRMRDVFITTDAILGIVGQTFTTVGLASMEMRSNLIDLLGGVQQANTSMQAYYQSFFTSEEQAVNGWKQMTAMLRQLGVDALPSTNAEFRALVEAQDLSTRAGQEVFAALIGLAPTFDQLTKSTAALQTQTGALAADLAKLSTDSFATLVDYTRALRLSQQRSGVSAANAQIAQVFANAPAVASVQSGKPEFATAAEQAQAVVESQKRAAAKASALRVLEAAKAAPYPTEPNDSYYSRRDMNRYSTQVAEWEAAVTAAQATYDSLPAFASGGAHTGGLRLVGENGPELEYTGPSTIYSNSDARNMLDNSGVIASVNALRDELRAIGLAIAAPIQKSYKVLDRWDGEGMPEVREAA